MAGKFRRLEKGEYNFDGGKKLRKWERDSRGDRFQEIKEPLDIKKERGAPSRSNVLHIGSRLPEGEKPLPPESDAEKMARLEEKISGELTDLEQRFAKSCIDEYPKELERAINKIESKGSTVAEKQISAIRTSYISDVKRWGLGRQLAPEKAEIVGKYLKLKLPVEIPEKKQEIVQSNNIKEIKEKEFTPEQSSEIRALTKEAIKIRNQVDPSELQEIIEEIIREDLISKGIFSEDDFPRISENVTKWIQKFNDKK